MFAKLLCGSVASVRQTAAVIAVCLPHGHTQYFAMSLYWNYQHHPPVVVPWLHLSIGPVSQALQHMTPGIAVQIVVLIPPGPPLAPSPSDIL